MPRMDGTGPQGAGAMTGRAAGPCADGYAQERGAGYGYGRGGRGMGRRCNFGQGFRNMNDGFSDRGNLKRQKSFLKERLEAIEKQLEEL